MQTSPVHVRVAGEITIPLDELPQMALQGIQSALTIVNEEKEKASSIKQFGWWDLPDTVALWRIERRRSGAEVLCVPRGFASQLFAGLAGLGIPVELDDQRTKVPASEGYFRPFLMRDYQLEAAVALLQAQQGIYRSAAGSGKTVTCLGAMAYANQRTLIVVDKAGLVEQWRARAARWFDFPREEVEQEDGTTVTHVPLKGIERTVGKIGQDVWEERDLTVALRQTLHSRKGMLDGAQFWRTWGMTFFDEVHHVAADTLGEISRQMTSFYVAGVSATPFKSPAKGQIVSALVGPIVHETPRQLLYDQGVLVRPIVEVLKGDFYAAFHPDHDAVYDTDAGKWVCQAEGCTKQARHSHRNNYSSVLKKLVEDEERNRRIAERIVAAPNGVHLVPSSQLKHLNLIRRELLELGWPKDKIWMLRGEENARGEDQAIVQAIERSDRAVILSTVAGEGLDIPPIDHVHISFPMRDEGATIQLAGRGERVWPGKESSMLVDYREPRVDVLEGQFYARERVYLMQSYPVIDSEWSIRDDADDASYPAEALQ